MAQIQVLDEETIDKIAAGEVVERPLNVVKELVENSVDAGAGAVTVEIKDGGVAFIRVTDNGGGISSSDVIKAFYRHATSKIRTSDDLGHISSLGFRGEALSSIAAVSQVELITKTPDSLTGVHYTIEGGKEGILEEVGAPNGTTIIMRNLFFNTPPRRKFLRQAPTEAGYITDMMEHLALCRPDISFQLIVNNSVKFHTSGNGDLKEVIYRIYGRDIANNLIEVKAEKNGMKLTGYVGKPILNRANRNYETFFVNKRYIRSQIIYRAIEEGCKNYLMQHKYPLCVLDFSIAPDEVDVNVHPTKMDVRFINRDDVFIFISSAISAQLRVQEMIPEAVLVEPEKTVVKEVKGPEPFEVNRINNSQSTVSPMPAVKVTSERLGLFRDGEVKREITNDDSVIINKILGNTLLSTNEAESINANVIKASETVVVEKNVQMELFEEKILTPEARGEYDIIGQIFDTYWIIAFRDKIFFVDQHAAHEKVKYERLMKQYRDKQVVSQNLNPPIIVNIHSSEEAIIKEYMSSFTDLGFELEEFGGNAYALRAVPTDLYGCNEKELFEEVLDELTESGGLSSKSEPAVICSKIASMSCKAAVKGNNKLSRLEINALIDELLTLENPYNCPHGRPTIFTMSKYEIDKKFKRIIN